MQAFDLIHKAGWASTCAAFLLLAACGGGGSGAEATPNKFPTAAAKMTGEAVLNASTAFDTTGTVDVDGSIASRFWDYGDGQTGTVDNHTYRATGTYTVTLSVTDDKGATASTSLTVTVAKCSTAGTQTAALSPHKTLCVQTTRGEMVFEVYPTQAPITAANFLKYVDDGFYSGTIFHRVIAGFVAQGGGYLPGLTAKMALYAPIALESSNGLKNWQYTLAMARTNVANSATSQFFVNLVANPNLDYNAANASPNGYAVFGQVISGTAVVDAIGTVATASAGGLTDVPVQDVVIRSMVRMP